MATNINEIVEKVLNDMVEFAFDEHFFGMMGGSAETIFIHPKKLKNVELDIYDDEGLFFFINIKEDIQNKTIILENVSSGYSHEFNIRIRFICINDLYSEWIGESFNVPSKHSGWIGESFNVPSKQYLLKIKVNSDDIITLYENTESGYDEIECLQQFVEESELSIVLDENQDDNEPEYIERLNDFMEEFSEYTNVTFDDILTRPLTKKDFQDYIDGSNDNTQPPNPTTPTTPNNNGGGNQTITIKFKHEDVIERLKTDPDYINELYHLIGTEYIESEFVTFLIYGECSSHFKYWSDISSELIFSLLYRGSGVSELVDLNKLESTHILKLIFRNDDFINVLDLKKLEVDDLTHLILSAVSEDKYSKLVDWDILDYEHYKDFLFYKPHLIKKYKDSSKFDKSYFTILLRQFPKTTFFLK